MEWLKVTTLPPAEPTTESAAPRETAFTPSDAPISPAPYAGQHESALLRILHDAGARRVLAAPAADLGLLEQRPFPFMALVGQYEMRLALLLGIINPAVGGVLLIGPRGTGKTTAVRSLTDLLPDTEISDMDDGALASDMQQPNARILYPESFARFEQGEPISHFEKVKLVELPLNARLEDVVGGVNERIAVQQNRVRLEKGILARADGNLLYIDEVNLLPDELIDAILDAAAQGNYTVRRGAMAGTYRARFVLIGSMNPEEGRLRPQILDRFGLRVHVRGLLAGEERLEVYRRVHAYRQNAARFTHEWERATAETRDEILAARERLPDAQLSDQALRFGMMLIERLQIDSHRAEYTMFEAARAYAAADGRSSAETGDVRAVAPLALRQRQSEFMNHFFKSAADEDAAIHAHVDAALAGK